MVAQSEKEPDLVRTPLRGSRFEFHVKQQRLTHCSLTNHFSSTTTLVHWDSQIYSSRRGSLLDRGLAQSVVIVKYNSSLSILTPLRNRQSELPTPPTRMNPDSLIHSRMDFFAGLRPCPLCTLYCFSKQFCTSPEECCAMHLLSQPSPIIPHIQFRFLHSSLQYPNRGRLVMTNSLRKAAYAALILLCSRIMKGNWFCDRLLIWIRVHENLLRFPRCVTKPPCYCESMLCSRRQKVSVGPSLNSSLRLLVHLPLRHLCFRLPSFPVPSLSISVAFQFREVSDGVNGVSSIRRANNIWERNSFFDLSPFHLNASEKLYI